MKKVFYLNVHHIENQSDKEPRLSNLFSKIDQNFITKNQERKDLMRLYKDLPQALDKLYTD